MNPDLVGALGLPGALAALIGAAYGGVRLWQLLQGRNGSNGSSALAAELRGGFQGRVEERLDRVVEVLDRQITEGQENRAVLIRLTDVLDQVSARLATHDDGTKGAVSKVDAIYNAVVGRRKTR